MPFLKISESKDQICTIINILTGLLLILSSNHLSYLKGATFLKDYSFQNDLKNIQIVYWFVMP